MKTPVQNQTETRFVALMSELFQTDEAQALDFGIYRVIRRHNHDIKTYLGEVRTSPDGQQTLHGGTLAATLDQAFAASDDESLAADKFRLQDLEKLLGLKPGMTQTERAAQLVQAEGMPPTQTLAAEYRSRSAAQTAEQTVQQDRSEVLNRLYQFFARHYQDGDFIVERRYGKGGARWVKSTGDDTEFHWATEDMYYIKSGDIFTDFDLRLSTGQALRLTVEPLSLQATRAALKPNDKAHYELVSATRGADGLTTVLLGYEKGAQTEAQKEKIISATCQAAQANATQANTELRRWLAAFMARNQSDFFIHKRLQEALSDDLDIYIKTELLDADQLLAGTSPATCRSVCCKWRASCDR